MVYRVYVEKKPQFAHEAKGLENDIIKSVRFEGGCNGNTKGIAALVVGMKTNEVIERLNGVKCGFKNTSCPDQLAEALKEYKNAKGD